MKIRSLIAALLAAQLLVLPALAGQMTKTAAEGGQASTTIVDTAAASPDHETLVAALQAAGLVETLQGEGPFTVFAPTDGAFASLPAGTVETLLEPGNRDQLTAILTYHVVAGRVSSKDIVRAIESNGGSASFSTVQQEQLTFRIAGGDVVVEDARGGTARVAMADLMQSNGVIHVVDGVLLPN